MPVGAHVHAFLGPCRMALLRVSHNTAHTCELCATTLDPGSESNREAMREAGAIPMLIALLGTQGGSKAEQDAAGALWNLTEQNSANCQALLEAGGVQPLVSLIAHEVGQCPPHASLFDIPAAAPEPLWRLAENALVNLLEAPPSLPSPLLLRQSAALAGEVSHAGILEAYAESGPHNESNAIGSGDAVAYASAAAAAPAGAPVAAANGGAGASSNFAPGRGPAMPSLAGAPVASFDGLEILGLRRRAASASHRAAPILPTTSRDARRMGSSRGASLGHGVGSAPRPRHNPTASMSIESERAPSDEARPASRRTIDEAPLHGPSNTHRLPGRGPATPPSPRPSDDIGGRIGGTSAGQSASPVTGIPAAPLVEASGLSPAAQVNESGGDAVHVQLLGNRLTVRGQYSTGRSLRGQATAEIVRASHEQGLLTRGAPPKLPARLLGALQHMIEPRLDAAQEGTDGGALEAVLADAASLGFATSRLEEARARFEEVAVVEARKARREALGLSNISAPDEFRCPLTLTPMRDPVVASDGHSYERKAIEEVLRTVPPRSPLTREVLRPELVSNHALRRRIEEHEGELDRTLEEVAAALMAKANSALADARAEATRLRALLASQAGLAPSATDEDTCIDTVGCSSGTQDGTDSAAVASSTATARRSSKRSHAQTSPADLAPARKRRGGR